MAGDEQRAVDVEALRDDHQPLLAVHVARAQHRVPGAIALRIEIDRARRHAAFDQPGAHGRRLDIAAAHDEILHLARLPQRRRRIEPIDEVVVGPALRPDRRRPQHQGHLRRRHLGSFGKRPGRGKLGEPSVRKPRQQHQDERHGAGEKKREQDQAHATHLDRRGPRLYIDTMPRLSTAEATVESLLRHGLDTVYALPGLHNDPLFDAFYHAAERLRVIHPRHEQTAAYMALGAALATGKPQAFAVVPGPGLLNAGAALLTAYGMNAPVIGLIGQIPQADIDRGHGHLHEVHDQLGLMRHITKWAERIREPAGGAPSGLAGFLARHLGPSTAGGAGMRARYLGQARRSRAAGCAVAAANRDDRRRGDHGGGKNPGRGRAADHRRGRRRARGQRRGDQARRDAGSAGQLLSSRPRRRAELAPARRRHAGRTSAVERCRRGAGDRHALFIQNGSWGIDANLKVVRLDIDPDEHDRLRKPDVALVGDAAPQLRALIAALPKHNRPRHSRAQELKGHRAWLAERLSRLEPQLSFLKAIRAALPEDGIFVDEVSQIGFASRVALPIEKPRTFLSPGYQDNLGWGFGTALGAKAAMPDRKVLAIAGDGGFMYQVGELATAARHNLAVVVVVFDNGGFGNVKRIQQERYGNRLIASDLQNPDFSKLADSFGIASFKAIDARQLEDALHKAFALNAPALVWVPHGDVPSPWDMIMMPKVRG